MPSIKDHTTVKAIAREYCSNGRDKAQAMRTIGYAESSCKSGKAVGDVYGNLRIKEAIRAIDAKTTAKLDHTRQIAIDLLNEALGMARKQGNTTAIIAATRELNAISNLHNQTITTVKEVDTVPEADKEALSQVAADYKLKLA
jgi:hypothetical protein